VIHHIVVKTKLFLISGLAQRLTGSFELKHLGGLYRDYPWLAVLFLVPAMSLAGMPPLSGFFAKLALIRAGLEAGQYAVVAVALVVGLLTLFSMTKIWSEAFWKPAPPEARPVGPIRAELVLPVVLLAAVTVALGLLAEPVLILSRHAADQLLDRQAYITAVLGDSP
jgi:multicomponent Na+:H+ antiporter subunit D